MTRNRKFAIAGCLAAFVIIAATASSVLLRQTECRSIKSPNGDFHAIVTCAAWEFYVPMGPGSSGDKSGYVTVYTREGISCGTAPIELAWMVDEMQWSATTAELKLVADWDLLKHTVKLQ